MKVRKYAGCIMSTPQCKCVFIFRVNAPNHNEQKKMMFCIFGTIIYIT